MWFFFRKAVQLRSRCWDRVTSRKGQGEKVIGGGELILIRDKDVARSSYQIIPMKRLGLGEDVSEAIQVKLVWEIISLSFRTFTSLL